MDEPPSVFRRRRFRGGEPKLARNLLRFAQHHARFARNGNELEPFCCTPPGCSGVRNVNARRYPVLSSHLQNVRHGIREVRVVALKGRRFAERVV